MKKRIDEIRERINGNHTAPLMAYVHISDADTQWLLDQLAAAQKENERLTKIVNGYERYLEECSGTQSKQMDSLNLIEHGIIKLQSANEQCRAAMDFYNSVVFCGDCKKLLQPEDICTLRNEHRNHKDYCSLGERWRSK